jgi:hypothetical protein
MRAVSKLFLNSGHDQCSKEAMRGMVNSQGGSSRPDAIRGFLAVFAALTTAAIPTVQAANSAGPRLEPGIYYTNEVVPRIPWSIHVIRIDRSRKDLTFFSAHARDRVLGVSLLADQARGVPAAFGRAVAAINGDFYLRDNPTYAGDPRGLQIVNGELISAPSTVCVWFDTNGNPHLDQVKGNFQVTWPDGRKTPFGLNEMRPPGAAVLFTPTYAPTTRSMGGRELILEQDGNNAWLPLEVGQNYRARVREVRTTGNSRIAPGTMVLSLDARSLAGVPDIQAGAVLEISTATTPSLQGSKVAIGGGPALIQNGKSYSMTMPPAGSSRNWSERSKYERHPRSAFGWSPTHFYFVTVDGRQEGLSVGMKLAELADYMARLGCTEAINLDGGKSAQLWLSGHIVNSPCQGEDTVANSLLVLRKPTSP